MGSGREIALSASRMPTTQLRQARRWLLERGEVPAGLLAPGLLLSWQRSRAFGLEPSGRMPGAPHASGAQLARALEHQRELLAHARPVMEFLFEQTRDSDSMVILADGQGMLLHALGDADFAQRAERVALRPGAVWHEQWRGTNAIGTAATELAPVVVHAGEHYLERNGFLTCAAAPIFEPGGRLLGVLDISGDHRGYHRHTLGLVRTAARLIEQRLFETRHAAALRLRVHGQPEGIGTLADGQLALAEDGWIVGANAAALPMLGLRREDIGGVPIERVLDIDVETLLDWGRRASNAPRTLRRCDGAVFWARVEAGRVALTVGAPLRRKSVSTEAASADALSALDTGDPTLRDVIAKLRRVLDKPIALVLQGESGAGKEVLARAVHASGPRRAGPFVAVNCAALPETLIEAELFGYCAGAYTGARREGSAGRIREAHGGTLFLDEIGDMPLASQTRLLRVLQERQVVPLGGGKPVPVEFALICATHRRLREEIDAGRFRADLYYRINGLSLQLPPLRERQDLDELIAQLLREAAPGREVALAPDLLHAFARHGWPGNLRQLVNALRTACALLAEDEAVIDWAHLPDDLRDDLQGARNDDEASARASEARSPCDGDVDLETVAARTIEQAVAASGSNLSEAARQLGISRNTLYRKLRALGLRR
jgi:transcriptional regulator of acetoin/glycerol metabolism